MTKNYILSHTPRQICHENTLDVISDVYTQYSPIPFTSLQRVAFNSGVALALPPLDKIQSPADYTDAHGPNGETITAEQFAIIFTLFYALDQKRYEEIC